MRTGFALRHPAVPGALRAVGDTAARLARGGLSPRPRLAYVAGAYPELSETFVLEELREFSRQAGAPPVFAMFEGDGRLDGAPPARMLGATTRAQRARAAVMLALLHPLRTAATLAMPSRRLGARPRELLALAPNARELAGVRHVHCHFATDPATHAGRLASLTGASWSLTAHAYDIYLIQDRLERKLASARFTVTPTEANRGHLLARHGADPRGSTCCGSGSTSTASAASVPTIRMARSSPWARLVPKKGFHLLVEASALAAGPIPPVLIAGEGPERERLEALIDSTRGAGGAGRRACSR